MAVRDQNVSFRLTASEKARLETAAKAAGVKESAKYARTLVLSALDGGEVAQIRYNIELLRKELARLHRDVGNSVIRILQTAGGQSKEDAVQWSKSRLSVPPRERTSDPGGDE